MRVVLIGVAGAMGALARYALGTVVGPRTFPYVTLSINVVGSFLLGLVLTVSVARRWPPDVSIPIAVGFLGAFTTFSTFTWETITLGRTDRLSAAFAYTALSLALGFLAAGAGLRVGNLLGR